MRSIGFLISDKKNEKRRALIPKHLDNINNKKNIIIEKGYGEILGYSDLEYSCDRVSCAK